MGSGRAMGAVRLITPPQITNITALIDGSGVHVRWTINEFTRGTVAYGAQASVYTENASETYYVSNSTNCYCRLSLSAHSFTATWSRST